MFTAVLSKHIFQDNCHRQNNAPPQRCPCSNAQKLNMLPYVVKGTLKM